MSGPGTFLRHVARIARLAIGSAFVTLLLVRAVHAQEPVTLESTYGHVIRSKLNGAEYQLTVVLPPSYERNPTGRYPTLYVMDGNRWAKLLAVLLPRFAFRGALPEIIVVGIDYPKESGRYQDYGPLSQRYYPMDEKRGAAKYMRVVKEEIIPFVDSRYRSDPQDRGIGGHSMGGLFTAYALLHETDTFQRFWISSPSLFYEDEVLFKDFASFGAKQLSKPLYVFTDVGGDEFPSMQGTLERFGRRLVELHPEKIILSSLVVPAANHYTVPPSAIAPALQHLYRYRPQVIPAVADLLRFAGRYELPDERVITLVTDGNDLFYQDSSFEYQTAGALVRMTASAPNKFFLRGEALEIEFEAGTDTPRRLRTYDPEKRQWMEALRVPDGTPKRMEPPKVGRP